MRELQNKKKHDLSFLDLSDKLTHSFVPLSSLFLSRIDSAAYMCELCRQTFMVSAKPPLLWQHVQAKHPDGTLPTDCFPVLLKDFDPNDPTGEKAAKAAAAAKKAPPKKKKAAANDDLDALLNAGLKKGKGKK